jgi:hypothetical protein
MTSDTRACRMRSRWALRLQDRAILTHNIQDFAPLAATYFEQGIDHPGIIVARHFEKGELLRRTLALLNSLTAEELTNTLRFV